MSVPSSWSLPYWGGLTSAMMSKEQLYNAWLNANRPSSLSSSVPNISNPSVPTLELPSSDSYAGYNPNYQSELTPSENEMTFTEGYGLPGLLSSGLGAATSMGLNYAGLPGPLAGMLGSIVGQKAGAGINPESLANMGLGKALSALSPPLGMAYGLASMLGLNAAQGFGEKLGMYPGLTPGFEGGFWGTQGMGSGVNEATQGGYDYGGGTPGSMGVGAENAGADTFGSGITGGLGATQGAGSLGSGITGGLGGSFGNHLGGGLGGGLGGLDSSGAMQGSGGLNTGVGTGLDSGSWGSGATSETTNSNENQGTNAGTDTSYSGWKSGGRVDVGPLSRVR